MIYDHYSDVEVFEQWRWKNFTAKELSCKCCGEYYHDEYSLDLIQAAREIIGKPLVINSAHRCKSHNKASGGSKQSQHLRLAFDINLDKHDKEKLLSGLYEAGFTTFGLYRTFLHTDKRPWRLWIKGNKQEWTQLYDSIVKVG